MLLYLKNVYSILKFNINSLLKFEVFYKAIVSLILLPICIFLFNLSMKITGYSYLTFENIWRFLINPFFIITLLFIIIIISFITIFEISTLIIIFDYSHNESKIGVLEACRTSLLKCKKMFNIKYVLIPMVVLFLIPFLSIGYGSNFLNSIGLPVFISDYIANNRYLMELCGLIVIIYLWVLSGLIFFMHNIVVDDMNSFEAFKERSRIDSVERVTNFFKVFLIQLFFVIIYYFIMSIGILIIYLAHSILNNHNIIQSLLITFIAVFTSLMFLAFYALSNCTSYAAISVLYYNSRKKNNKIKIVKSDIGNRTIGVLNRRLKNTFVVLIFVALVGGSIFTYQVITGKANLNIEYTKNVEVTAHRGASKDAPENTMLAFKKAKEKHADWIELDVQPSKDGKMVIWHDYGLAFLTGKNTLISEMNYDEIRNIDLSGHFGKEYKDEKIIVLEDAIKFAKENNIRLNIELKYKYADDNFVKDVINLIKKYNFTDMCVVASSSYNALVKVKEIDSSIKTVYILSIIYGDFTDVDSVDVFSIEISNVSKKIVKKIHNSGKEIYVWTVNEEDQIKELIDMGVDNIITDDVDLCLYTVISNKNGNFINNIIKIIFNMDF